MAQSEFEGDGVFEAHHCLNYNNENTGELTVSARVTCQIKAIERHLNAIAVAGLYRTGKSYLMSRLAGQYGGFPLGSNVVSKTKGISFWCRPHPKDSNQVLLLLDTGLGDVAKGDANHDNTIFALATLLSRTLIYNMLGVLNQDVLDKLNYITEISKTIKTADASTDDSDLDLYFPDLILALRDKTLDMIIVGKEVTPVGHFEHCPNLLPGEDEDTNKKNKLRLCIRKYFKNRHCFMFKRLGRSKKLRKLEELTDDGLDKDSVEDTKTCKPLIMRTVSVCLLKSYISSINEGAVPCIENALRSMTIIQNQKVSEKAVQAYMDGMTKNFKQPAEGEKALFEFHQQRVADAVTVFLECSIQDENHEFQKKANEQWFQNTYVHHDLDWFSYPIISEVWSNSLVLHTVVQQELAAAMELYAEQIDTVKMDCFWNSFSTRNSDTQTSLWLLLGAVGTAESSETVEKFSSETLDVFLPSVFKPIRSVTEMSLSFALLVPFVHGIRQTTKDILKQYDILSNPNVFCDINFLCKLCELFKHERYGQKICDIVMLVSILYVIISKTVVKKSVDSYKMIVTSDGSEDNCKAAADRKDSKVEDDVAIEVSILEIKEGSLMENSCYSNRSAENELGSSIGGLKKREDRTFSLNEENSSKVYQETTKEAQSDRNVRWGFMKAFLVVMISFLSLAGLSGACQSVNQERGLSELSEIELIHHDLGLEAWHESKVVSVNIEQEQVFLEVNKTVELMCVATLTEKPYLGDFLWYRNGVGMKDISVAPQIVSPTEPVVKYDLKAKRAGKYTCQVQDLNATAVVYSIKGTAPQVRNIAESSINLQCDPGPNGTTVFMKIDCKVIENLGTSYGELTMKKAELEDAHKNYSCMYVFTNDLAIFGNKTSVPMKRTASLELPVIFYAATKRPLETGDILYNISLASKQKDVQVKLCGIYSVTNQMTCTKDQTVLFNSSFLVNFTIFLRGKNVVTGDSFKESKVVSVTMEQEQLFLEGNNMVELRCAAQLTEKPYTGDFLWYRNGVRMKGISVDPQIISPTEAVVKYDLRVKRAGKYTCQVTDLNATAIVHSIKGTAPQVVNVAESSIHLHCDTGPNGTTVFMKVDDKFVQDLKDTRYKETSYGEITMTKAVNSCVMKKKTLIEFHRSVVVPVKVKKKTKTFSEPTGDYSIGYSEAAGVVVMIFAVTVILTVYSTQQVICEGSPRTPSGKLPKLLILMSFYICMIDGSDAVIVNAEGSFINVNEDCAFCRHICRPDIMKMSCDVFCKSFCHEERHNSGVSENHPRNVTMGEIVNWLLIVCSVMLLILLLHLFVFPRVRSHLTLVYDESDTPKSNTVAKDGQDIVWLRSDCDHFGEQLFVCQDRCLLFVSMEMIRNVVVSIYTDIQHAISEKLRISMQSHREVSTHSNASGSNAELQVDIISLSKRDVIAEKQYKIDSDYQQKDKGNTNNQPEINHTEKQQKKDLGNYLAGKDSRNTKPETDHGNNELEIYTNNNNNNRNDEAQLVSETTGRLGEEEMTIDQAVSEVDSKQMLIAHNKAVSREPVSLMTDQYGVGNLHDTVQTETEDFYTERVFANLLNSYLNSINNGTVPCIENALRSMTIIENGKAVESAVESYRCRTLRDLNLPVEDETTLSSVHQQSVVDALKVFLGAAILDDNQEFQNKANRGSLSTTESNLHYKNEAKFDEAIRKLVQSFKISEERKIVAEIDKMRRLKNVLAQNFDQTMLDDVKAEQNRLRGVREYLYKSVTTLKNREDDIRRTRQFNKTRSEELKKGAFFLKCTQVSSMLQVQEEAKTPSNSKHPTETAGREGCKVTEASSTKLTVHLPEETFQDLKHLKQDNNMIFTKPVKVLVTDVGSDTESQLLSIKNSSKPSPSLSNTACPIDEADNIDYDLDVKGVSLMNESKISKESGTAKNKSISFHMVGDRVTGSYRYKSRLERVKQLRYQVVVQSRNICPEKGSFKIQQEIDEDDCHHIRKITWLPLDQLPVPKLDLTIALVHSQADEILKRIAKGETVGAQESMKYEILRVCTYRNYPSENKPFRIRLASAGLYYASENDEVVCFCCGLRKSGWNESDKPHEIHIQIKPSCDFFIRNESVNKPIPELTEDSLVKFRALEEAICSADALPQSQRSEDEARNHGNFDLNTSESPHYRFFTPPPKHPQYAVQSVRLESFKGWPTNIPQTAPIMAECGYYYAGFGDCVRCFHCGIGLRHWTEEDYPWVEHARWSKDCAYLRQMKGEEFIQNVHLAIEEDEEPEDLIPATPSGQPADMSQVTPNEDSNQILLTDPAQSVLEMGYQPRTIKKAIDIILRSEGRSGISAVKIMEKIFMLEERSNNLEQGVANMNISGTEANTDVQSQNSSGAGQTQNNGGRLQVPNTGTCQEAQSCSTTHQSQRNEGLALTQNSSTSQALGNTASGQTSRSNISHTQSITDNESPAQRGTNVKSTDTIQAKPATKRPLTTEKQNEAAASPKSSPHSSLEGKVKGATSGKSQSLKDTTKIKAENQKLKEQTICKVCLDKPVSIVFLPCGHLVTCAECAPAMKKCPICRALVKGSVKAFMS